MFTLLKLYNFLHLVCAVAWIGGMIFINVVFMPRLAVIAPQERGKLVGAVSKRFSIVAWTCAVIMLVTGYLKTPEGLLFETGSVYGAMLTIKHVLVLLMLLFGIMLSFVLAPKISRLAPKSGEPPSAEFITTQKTLSFFSVANTVLGVLVIVCIALMR
jgi:uncharacterized membrane protein